MADPLEEPTGQATSDATAREAAGPSTLTRFRRGFVRGIGIAAVALFTAFALANRQYVEFGWLFGSTEIQEVGGDRVSGGVPLIVLLVAAFVLGIVVGGAWASLRSRSRRREQG